MNSVGVCVAWLVGCALGLLGLGAYPGGLDPVYGWMFLTLAALALVPAFLIRETRLFWSALLLGAALAGCGRALATHPPIGEGDLAYYNVPADGPKALVVGVVQAEPGVTDRAQRLLVSAEGIRFEGETTPRPVDGDVLAFVARYPEYAPGTRVALSGTLTIPPRFDTFDYAAYLARQGVYSYMTFPRVNVIGTVDVGLDAFISTVRSRVADAIRSGLPEPHAALTVGVVTGDRGSIPEQVQVAFQRSGTSHILAISGQNIALIVGLVYLFYGGRNRKRRLGWAMFTFVAGVLAVYTFFTGATPSVVRAAVMGVVLLMSPLALRRPDPIAALSVSAVAMTLLDPDILMDAGFQLSFAAMLGLTILAPPVNTGMGRLRIPGIVSLPFAVGVGTQVTTVPLLVILTRLFSNVSIVATAMASLALFPLMVMGMLAGIVGAIIPPLAPLFGVLAWPFASWLLWCVDWWGSLPWAAIEVNAFSPLWAAGYYTALACAVHLAAHIRRERLQRTPF